MGGGKAPGAGSRGVSMARPSRPRLSSLLRGIAAAGAGAARRLRACRPGDPAPRAGSSRRGGRPTAALRAGAGIALLLAGTIAALPSPARAQTNVTLVDNSGQSESAWETHIGAQSFTTGDADGGYLVTEVKVRIRTGNNTTVRIREDDSSSPGNIVATLTNPSSLSTGLAKFTAPAGTTLAADTTYWLVVNDGLNSGRIGISYTGSNSQMGESGWEIGDGSLRKQTTSLSWSSSNDSIRMEIVGSRARQNSPATGAPSVSGTARVGSTLTASTAGIRDADGLGTFSYQWTREDEDASNAADISGATSSTYSLASDDNGKRVRVKVSFTDGQGFEEERTSPAFPSRGTVAMPVPEMTDPSDIWSATLTAEAAGNLVGCIDNCEENAVLTDDDFTFDSTTYSFEQIYVESGTLTLDFDRSLPSAASNWELRITEGGSTTTLDFSDDEDTGGQFVVWSSTGLSWSSGDTISLAIRDPGTGDVTPPEFHANHLILNHVDGQGSTISVYFDEPLDQDNLPPMSAFKVTVDSNPVTIGRVSSLGQFNLGHVLVLDSLSFVIQRGQTVRISYFDPTTGNDANALQDTAGNDVATFENLALDNRSTIVGVPGKPTGLTATAEDADPDDGETEIALSWTAPTDIGEAAIDGYRIEWSADGSTNWTELVEDTGSADTTYTDEELGSEETRHYRVSARNSFGAGSASDSASATTADIEGPVLTGAELNTEGNLLLTFDEAVDRGLAAPTKSAFAVTADGVLVDFEFNRATDVVGIDVGRVRLRNFSPVIREGQAVVVTYTDPTSGDDPAAIQDTTGNDADSFTTGADDVPAVTNNSNVSPVAPGMVPNLEAEAGSGGTSIVLTWERPADNGGRVISSYRIEVCETSCDQESSWAEQVATHNEMADGAIVLSYEHTGLPAGATRHYRVAARNSVGLGAWSDPPTMGQAVHPGAPDAPTGLTATAQDSDTADGETEIALSWTKPADEGDTNITGYRIEWSADGNPPWNELEDDTGSRATSYIDDQLDSETTRHYRVIAINDQGRSLPSNVDDATTDDVAGPEPQSASVPEAGTSVAIVFDEALDETAGRLPRASRFAVTAADGAVFTVGSVAVDDKTVTLALASDSATIRTGQALTVVYTDPSTSDETAGVIQDDDGNDAATFTLAPSGTVMVTNGSNQAVGNPGVPRNVATLGGGDSITVRWDAPLETGGQAIEGYSVQISLDGTSFIGTQFVDAPATSYTQTGLNVGDERWYRVRTQAGTGSNTRHSPYSGTVRGVTLHPDAPGAPTGLTATAGLPTPRDGTTQIRLSWTKPTDEGTPNISGYRIEWSADGSTDWTELEENTGTRATSYIDPGLESETTRYYRVFAINSSGRSLASNVDDATTADIEGPEPQSASVPTSGDSIAIVFNEALDETTANLPQASRFAVTAADGAVFRVGTVEVDDMTVTLNLHADSPTIRTGQALTVVYTDRTANDDARFVVQDDDGNDAADFTLGPSETVTVTNGSNQAVGAPGTPRNVRAESGGDDRIVVSWDAPADTGGRAITGYRVEVSDQGPGGPFTQLVGNHNAKNSAGRFEYVDTGLSVGQQRWYRVTGRNGPNDADLGMNSQVRQGVVDRKGDVVLSLVDTGEDPAEGGRVAWRVTATTDEDAPPESGLSMQVTVTSSDGTATAPGDYAAVDATVTFQRSDFRRQSVGAEQRYVAVKDGAVSIADDLTVEPEEAFTLSMAVGTGGTGWVAGTDEVEVTVADDDAWAVRMETSPPSIVEGETRQIRFTARILHVDTDGTQSVPPADTCVVPFDVLVDLAVEGTATGEGTDYTIGDSSYTGDIAACAPAAEGRFTMTALVDAVDDDGETVTLTPLLLSTPELEPAALEAGSITIGEEPGVVLGAAALGVEEGGSATYTAVLTARPTGTVTLTPSVSGDTDVMVSPRTLTFTPQNWSLPRTLTVSARQDADDEDDTAVVSHAVSGADYGGVNVGRVQVSVRDDDKSFGVLRVHLSGWEQGGGLPSTRDPAPRVHHGGKVRIALHWQGAVRVGPWDDPWKALGADRAIRVTGGTVRPVGYPGYVNERHNPHGWAQHVLMLEFTPDGAGSDVVLTVEPMDCSYPDWRISSPDPRAICGRVDNGRGGGRITGLAERVRWTVHGIDSVPPAPTGLTVETEDEVALSDTVTVTGQVLFASFDPPEPGATRWRVEAQAAGGDWSRPRAWRGAPRCARYPCRVRLGGLDPDGAWEIRARWENRHGAGPWAEVETDGGPPLAAPRGVRIAQEPDGHSVRLTWSAPAGSAGRLARYQYKLDRPGEAGVWRDIPDSGPGAENAASFTVDGLSRTWETGAQLRAVDRAGRAGAASAIARVPAAAPTVLEGGVRATSDPGADGRYTVGDEIGVAVLMSRPVRLEGAEPTVTLEIGSARRTMALARIDGTAAEGAGIDIDPPGAGEGDVLHFAYTVRAGDEDTDGIRVPAGGLGLNGGRLLDASDTGSGAAARFRLDRAVGFPDHLVQGVLPRVVKVERLGNQVWVHFARGLRPWTLVPDLRNSVLGGQFRVHYSESRPVAHAVSDARIVRGRGWHNNCNSAQTDCRVVRLTLGPVRRQNAPQVHGAPLPGETVRISYVPNPNRGQSCARPVGDTRARNRCLCDAVGNEVAKFGPVTAVPLGPGDAMLSVTDADGFEQPAHRRWLHFQVRLKPAAASEVRVSYRTQELRVVDDDRVIPHDYLVATAGVDYDATDGELVFAPGEREKTVSVRILDDRIEDSGEVVALVLSDPEGPATIGDGVGQGLIHNHEVLTASFHGLPESHDGTAAFGFELAFSEPVTADAESLRDHALSVTGGTASAVAAAGSDAQRFTVTVEPSGTDDVTLRIGPSTDCDADGAVCTDGKIGLERSFEATVAYGEAAVLAAPAITGVPQVGATLTAAFDEPPGGTIAWQWRRGGAAIPGADAAAYAPVAADVGAALSVRATRGAASATSAPTAPVWPAPASPPLAAGEEALLSTVLTLGSWDGFPLRIAGYGRFAGAAFGEIDDASFDDDGTARTIELFMVNEMGRFALATGAELPAAAGLVAYWNGHRIADLESRPASHDRDMLAAATPMPRDAWLRYVSGGADGVRVAVSLRRARTVVRVTAAAVTSGPGENGTWDAGETVEAELRFSAPVTVTGGPPTLALLLDGTRRAAAYGGGSGTDTLTFSYTVTDADAGARRARIPPNGLSLEGAVLSAGANTVVETGFAVAPWITAVAIAPDASDDREWTAGETIEARLTFSEPVTVADGAPWLQVTIAGFDHPGTLGYASGSGTDTLSFSTEVPGGAFTGLAVVADSLTANGATIVSTAGGLAAELGHGGTEPTAAPGEAAEAGPLTASFEDVPPSHGGQPFTLLLRFGEELSVSYLTLRDAALRAAGGAVSAVRRATPGENREWRVTVTPDEGAGDVTVTLPARACGEAGAVCTEDERGLAVDVTATVPVEVPADAPFRVRLKNVPEEHDGTTPVVFEVEFTKQPAGYSYRTLRDETLVIRQGGEALTATSARRLDPSQSDRWEVTVTPASKADLTVRIGPFSSCSETGAVCAADDEVLANEVERTIQGPPGLSVADARVDENTGDPVVFAVTLGRASRHTVTVDYATSDGTGANAAVAGEDYEETSGTLTFAPGDTEKTVSVPVLPDSHDEGEETFTLTLSNPQGGNAWLRDATATGTIENSDAMPRAWLARFGRTVAEQVIEAVEGRFAAARAPGIEMTLAGQSIGSSGAEPEGPGSKSGAGEDARRAAAEEAEARSKLAAMKDWLQGAERDGDDPGSRAGFKSRAVTPRDLLTGSSFALTGEAKAGGLVSLWGRGAVSRFDGRDGGLTLSGEVVSVMLGADWSGGPGSKPGAAPASGRGAWTAGLLVSRSEGAGSYSDPGSGTGSGSGGEVSSTLTGLYPYGRYAMNDRVTVWGVAGYGAGELVLTPEGPDRESRSAKRTDMDLAMGAVGLRGVAVEAPAEGGVELAVTTDAMAVRTTSQKTRGLAAAEAGVTRLRLGLEGTWRGLEAGGGTLAPRLEVGVRHDGGDAETGFGLDLGGGLAWSHPEGGLSAELSGRGLLTHESRGFRDRGLSGSLAWDPGQGSGRGPKLTLTQTLGASASGGMDALLGQRDLGGLAANDDEADDLENRRLELRMGYGFPAFGDRFTATPELGLRLANGHREYTLGWRMNLVSGGANALEFRLEGTRREAANDDAEPEHGIRLRLEARF